MGKLFETVFISGICYPSISERALELMTINFLPGAISAANETFLPPTCNFTGTELHNAYNL